MYLLKRTEEVVTATMQIINTSLSQNYQEKVINYVKWNHKKNLQHINVNRKTNNAFLAR